MKNKIAIAFASVALLLNTGCKKEAASSPLEGYWTLEKQNIGGTDDTQLQGATWYFSACEAPYSSWCESIVDFTGPPTLNYTLDYQLKDSTMSILRIKSNSGINEKDIVLLDGHNFVTRDTLDSGTLVTETYYR